MQWQDSIYAILLGTSILAGCVVRQARGSVKRGICLILGLAMAVFICGPEIWHAFVLTGGFVIFYSLVSFRFIHYIIFLWCFSYLGFFHTSHLYGFNRPSPFTKMFQLFLTLRVVGVSFELHDTWKYINALKPTRRSYYIPETNVKLQLKYRGIVTTPYDIISYIYCYIGMLTGPYYTYRTFNDMLSGLPKRAPRLTLDPFWRRIQEAPFFGAAYLITSNLVSSEYLQSPDFYEQSWLLQLVHVASVFFVFRMRLYFAWVLGECVCMSVGLGAYPVASRPAVGVGPTDLNALDRFFSGCERNGPNEVNYDADDGIDNYYDDKDPIVIESSSHFYNYATVQTVSVWRCEFCSTLKDSMRAWNQTVFYWLEAYFYRRCPGPRPLRVIATLAIGAAWYGLHPAYFLAMLSLPLISLAEKGLTTTLAFLGVSLPPGGLNFVRWFFKMRALEYLAAGWILLRFEDAHRCWAALGYFVQIVGVVLGLAHVAMKRFVSPFERWEVEHPGEDVADVTAATGKSWDAPEEDTFV